MDLNTTMMFLGLISAAYLVFKLLNHTVKPTNEVLYKEVGYYGDDNIIFNGIFGTPSKKTSISTSNSLKFLKYNNAEFFIDNTQFTNDFNYYKV